MREMIKPTLSLLVICFGTAFCLALVNSLTSDVIAKRKQLADEASRKEVLAAAERFESVKIADSNHLIEAVYAGYQGQELTGYVFSALPKGYAGEINVIVGISTEGKILGVKIGDNQETPGLGSKAAERSFWGQYLGKKPSQALTVVKQTPATDYEIQAISGATITSKAVTSAVQASLELTREISQKGSGN